MGALDTSCDDDIVFFVDCGGSRHARLRLGDLIGWKSNLKGQWIKRFQVHPMAVRDWHTWINTYRVFGDGHFAHYLFVTMNPAEMSLLSGHDLSMILLLTASNRIGGSRTENETIEWNTNGISRRENGRHWKGKGRNAQVRKSSVKPGLRGFEVSAAACGPLFPDTSSQVELSFSATRH